MKKNILIISTCLAVFVLAGCSEDKIESWNSQGRAWFTTTDVENCTFIFDSETTMSKEVDIPITLAAGVGTKERTISLEVTRDKSDSQTKYELESSIVVPADSVSATLKMKVYKTDNLALAPDTIVVKIVSSEDFLPGLLDYQSKTIVLYNDFIEPDWWKVSRAKYTFGKYTKAKCKLYYQIIGNLDDPRQGESSWFSTLNCQLVKYKLDSYVSTYHPVDEDGNAIDFSTY